MSDSNVTNLDDLEQYGVWVKVGPTDVEDGDEQFAMSDIEPDNKPMEPAGLINQDDQPGEDLTPEEEALLDPLEEALDSDDSASDITDSPVVESEDDLDDFDADIDELSLDDLSEDEDFSFDDGLTEETPAEETEQETTSASIPLLDEEGGLKESFAVGSDNEVEDLSLDLEDDGLDGFDEEAEAAQTLESSDTRGEDKAGDSDDVPPVEDFGEFDDLEELDLDIEDFDESEVPEAEVPESDVSETESVDSDEKPESLPTELETEGEEGMQGEAEEDLNLEIETYEDPREIPSLDLDSVTEDEINAALGDEDQESPAEEPAEEPGEEPGEEDVGEQSEETEELSLADDELDSIDLDDLDAEEVEEDLPELELDSLEEDELTTLEEPAEPSSDEGEAPTDVLEDFDLPELAEDELPAIEADEADSPTSGIEELGELDEVIEADEVSDGPQMHHGETPPTHGFTLEEDTESEDNAVDDLLAEEHPPVEAAAPAPAAAAAESSESVKLLQTIESDLSQIKQELLDLRQELAGIRAGKDQAAADTDISGIEGFTAEGFTAEGFTAEGFEPESEEIADSENGAAGTGFFEDDEDETIALTGDELDNILNTAEFTEEVGEPTEVDDSELLSTPVLDDGDTPVLDGSETAEPNDTDTAMPKAVDNEEEPPIEEITLDQLGEDEEAPSDIDLASDDADDELSALADLDVDSELADIDELKDQAEEDEQVGDGESDAALEPDAEIVLYPEGDLEQPEQEPEAPELPDSPETHQAAETRVAPETASPEGAEITTAAAGQVSEAAAEASEEPLSGTLRTEIKSVLAYMDQLLEALPEDKIEEFAKSEHFEVYKRLFEELGLE